MRPLWPANPRSRNLTSFFHIRGIQKAFGNFSPCPCSSLGSIFFFVPQRQKKPEKMTPIVFCSEQYLVLVRTSSHCKHGCTMMQLSRLRGPWGSYFLRISLLRRRAAPTWWSVGSEFSRLRGHCAFQFVGCGRNSARNNFFASLLWCFSPSSIAVDSSMISCSRDGEFDNLLTIITSLTMSGRVRLRDSFLVGSMDAACEATLRLRWCGEHPSSRWRYEGTRYLWPRWFSQSLQRAANPVEPTISHQAAKLRVFDIFWALCFTPVGLGPLVFNSFA